MAKEELDDDFVDLVCKMLTKDPTKRITLDQIKQHPYFHGETPSQQQVQKELYFRWKSMQTKTSPKPKLAIKTYKSQKCIQNNEEEAMYQSPALVKKLKTETVSTVNL
jgi:serine/threonine protein kinase